MAKKTLGYLELHWRCPNCGTQNLGSLQTCVSCGSPQPEGVAFEQVSSQVLLNDEEKINAAKQAADIHCPYCGTRNSSSAQECRQCSGDLKDGTRRVQGQVLGAFGSPVQEMDDKSCPSCHQPNAATAAFCVHCGSPLQQSPEPQHNIQPSSAIHAPEDKAGKKKFPILIIILLAFLGIACVIGILIALLSGGNNEALTGTVTDLYWQRSMEILELQTVTREDWREDVPSGDHILNCEERYYRTQNDAAPGALEVCGTPYTVDQGNGYAEVVQDCAYEIYKDYCSYQTQDWVLIDTLQAGGDDHSAYWPAVDLNTSQMTGDQNEQYTITLNADGHDYRYETNDYYFFQQVNIGSSWLIETGLFGAIKNISPVE